MCHIIPFAMSRGLEIQAPSPPERDITGLLPSGCLRFISPLCRNKALKSVGGHTTDVCFMGASGAKSCTSNAELTMSVKVWFLGEVYDFIFIPRKLLNAFFSYASSVAVGIAASAGFVWWSNTFHKSEISQQLLHEQHSTLYRFKSSED